MAQDDLIDNAVVYSDLNPELGLESQFELVTNEQAIQASILTIVRTRKGSRPFRRTFGSRIMDMLFDPITDTTAAIMRSELLSALQKEEPRLTLQNIRVVADEGLEGYYVSIEGFLPKLEKKKFAFNFNLVRDGNV